MDFFFTAVDRYNWDTDKSVKIADVVITDVFMGWFHQRGLAQEFNLSGKKQERFKWDYDPALTVPKMEPSQMLANRHVWLFIAAIFLTACDDA